MAQRAARVPKTARAARYPPRIKDAEAGKTVLGMPLRTKWRKGMLAQSLWDPRDDAVLFPPKSYGIGWSLNFAYPLIKTKPLWKRALAFIVCLALILVLLWALTALILLLYYLATPPQTLEFVITANGSIVPA